MMHSPAYFTDDAARYRRLSKERSAAFRIPFPSASAADASSAESSSPVRRYESRERISTVSSAAKEGKTVVFAVSAAQTVRQRSFFFIADPPSKTSGSRCAFVFIIAEIRLNVNIFNTAARHFLFHTANECKGLVYPTVQKNEYAAKRHIRFLKDSVIPASASLF